MKVSKLHSEIIIPPANDLFTASAIASRVGFMIGDVAAILRSRGFVSGCKAEETDGKRAEKIAVKIRKACALLESAGLDLRA